MRYYGSVWEPAAHFPYNFLFLTDVDDHTNAPALHKVIVGYLANLTRDQFPNWVVSSKHRICEAYHLCVSRMKKLLRIIVILRITHFTITTCEA